MGCDLMNDYVEDHLPENTPGIDLPLNTPWTLWVQHLTSQLQYEVRPVARFRTIGGFWCLFNYIEVHEHHFIFMREGFPPEWNAPIYHGGGYLIISLKTIKDDRLVQKIFLDFLLGLIGETLVTGSNSDHLTGISMVKNKIKIWVKGKVPEGLSGLMVNISSEFRKILADHEVSQDFYYMSFGKIQRIHKYQNEYTVLAQETQQFQQLPQTR